MPAAYIIVDMKITDMDQYKQYMAAAPGTTEFFNMVLIEGV